MNAELRRAYNRERMARWRRENPEEAKAKDARDRIKYAVKRAESNKKWRQNNARRIHVYRNEWEKGNRCYRNAYQTVYRALLSGRLTKPEVCQNCQEAPTPIEAHHYMGYARENWLNVKWLCRMCHHLLEGKRNTLNEQALQALAKTRGARR
jgi:hypothetical protein